MYIDNMSGKNIYITWHYTTHGIAYLKHILSAFYSKKELEKNISFDEFDQDRYNKVFDNPKKDGFIFDEIIYLTAPQAAFDKINSRLDGKNKILEDQVIINSGLKEVYEKIVNNDSICYNLEKEIEFVKKDYSDKLKAFEDTIWRNIHRYSIDEQIQWLKERSNFKNYKSIFKEEKMEDIEDLRDEKTIAENLNKRIKEITANQDDDTQYIINVSLGSSETQVAWHILMEASVLPKNTRFIKAYDDKSKVSEKGRFKLFSIKEISTKIISDIADSFIFYPKPISPTQYLLNKKMSVFLKSGFSILLIGERGIGKSAIVERLAEEFKESKLIQGKLVPVDCASFTDNLIAESELFGYAKGAFTGAFEDKDGLIKEAENGILFFDEVHNLSPVIQAKLMRALSTKNGNLPHVRKVGGKEFEVKNVKLIFATNISIDDLKTRLSPDFYDRIVQHVIKIPSIKEDERLEAKKEYWEDTWMHLFGGIRPRPEIPNEKTDKDLMDWLQREDLDGNRRDLEKIAIYYNAYNKFDEMIQKQENVKSAFDYARREFELYKYSSPNQIVKMRSRLSKIALKYVKNELKKLESLPPEQTKDIVQNVFKIADEFRKILAYHFQKLALKKYRTRKETAKKLGVGEKTLNNWKNGTIP